MIVNYNFFLYLWYTWSHKEFMFTLRLTLEESSNLETYICISCLFNFHNSLYLCVRCRPKVLGLIYMIFHNGSGN
jgi:hypothetical protein